MASQLHHSIGCMGGTGTHRDGSGHDSAEAAVEATDAVVHIYVLGCLKGTSKAWACDRARHLLCLDH
jgi:hypothetical protein